MSSIEITHPGAKDALKRGAFSVAHSMIPGCRADVDKIIEETFMKNSKSHGRATGAGISGIIRNHTAYQRWMMTTYAGSQFLETTFSLDDI